MPDREPQPTDGPDYHADHAAWAARQPLSEVDKAVLDCLLYGNGFLRMDERGRIERLDPTKLKVEVLDA